MNTDLIMLFVVCIKCKELAEYLLIREGFPDDKNDRSPLKKSTKYERSTLSTLGN